MDFVHQCSSKIHPSRVHSQPAQRSPVGMFTCRGKFGQSMKILGFDFLNQILQCISNTIPYLDNIYVTGKNDEKHLQNLRQLCARLLASRLRLYQNKCKIIQKSIPIIDFVIDKNGLHESKMKVKVHRNQKELLSLLEFNNFYSCFLDYRLDKLIKKINLSLL